MNTGALSPATLFPNCTVAEWLTGGRQWQGIPAVEVTEKGRLFAAWYSGGKTEEPGNIVVIEKSDDDGKTWTDGLLIVHHDDPKVRCFDEAMWIDPCGRLWCFWTQSEDKFDGRDGVWCTVCTGPDADSLIFSSPRRIADGLMLNKPIVKKDGEWLLPVALWAIDVNASMPVSDPHPELNDRRMANVYSSKDNGQTFTFVGGADVPQRSFDEHMVVELNDGRLWMLVRTTYGIGQAFSSDGGKTWADIGESGHSGPNSRFYIGRLKSGKLLLINHINPTYTTAKTSWSRRDNLCALLSDDDGKTWTGILPIDVRNQVSYPDVKQVKDGSIYVIYDYQRYGEREILLAKITEEDILAGQLVSKGSYLRRLVNKLAVSCN